MTTYNHYRNEELLRLVMATRESTPLERELAQRLEVIMYDCDEDDECGCYTCDPGAWQ